MQLGASVPAPEPLRLRLGAQPARLEAVERDERRWRTVVRRREGLLEGAELDLHQDGAAQRGDARAVSRSVVVLARHAGVHEAEVARQELVEAVEDRVDGEGREVEAE